MKSAIAISTRLYIILLPLYFIRCSAIEDIHVGLDHPRLVVNSLFTPDSTWQIDLSRSGDILDGNHYFPSVDSADVKIYDQNNALIETLAYSSDKAYHYKYRGKTIPVEGQLYTVKIKVKNETSLQATNHIPSAVPISSVEIDSSLFKSQGERVQMKVSFTDPENQKNYYQIKIVRDGYYLSNKDTIHFLEDVHYELIDPAFKNSPRAPVNDNLFDGKNYSFNFKVYRDGYSGVTKHVRIVLLSISEEYYLSLITQDLQHSTSNDPFAQPVQIFSNIENGLGIFAGYNSTVVNLK